MNTTQAPPSTQPVYEITAADRDRQKRIARGWQAYEGELQKPFEQMDDEPDLNVMGNEVQPPVDGVCSFVFGDEVEISVEQGAPDGAQELLDKVWTRKEKRLPLLQRWIMNGDIAGCAFLRIVPSPEPPPEQTYDLVEVDPATIFVSTVPQNCQKVLLFCIEYSCDEKNTLGNPVKMFYREEIQRIGPDGFPSKGVLSKKDTWSIQHWTQETQSGTAPTNKNWVPAGEPIPWPYPFPPIFSNQNLPKPNDFWGYAGVSKSLIGINEAINFVNSNINITSKLQRILFASGMGEGTIDVVPNKIQQLPEDSKIEAVNLQSDVANSREFAGDLRGEAEELSGVPMIASGRTANMPSGNIPGITMRLMFQSLLKKMGKMRCLYGGTMIDISQAILTLANFKGEDIDITLGWQDPLPADELHDIQAAIALGELGVSKTTRMRKMGYDPVEEAKLCAEEAARDAALAPQLPVSPPGVPALPGQPKPVLPGQEQPSDTQQQNGGQQ